MITRETRQFQTRIVDAYIRDKDSFSHKSCVSSYDLVHIFVMQKRDIPYAYFVNYKWNLNGKLAFAYYRA